MPKKNIVVCLDGTGNLFREENSNVIKLFQISRRCPGEQIAYYDPASAPWPIRASRRRSASA